MKSGPLILKKALREIHIDTNATSTTIRKNLSNLDTNIDTVRHGINKFNVHVKKLIQFLIAKRGVIMDLMEKLFKVYKISLG